MLSHISPKGIGYNSRISRGEIQIDEKRTHNRRRGSTLKLRKKLLSVVGIAVLGVTMVTTTASAATPAVPTPSDFGRDGVWICKNPKTGEVSWPIHGQYCPRGTIKMLWQPPKDDGHNQRGVALETLSMDFGDGNTVKCSRNVSRDPKNPVFKGCVATGQLAKALNPAPIPQPTASPTRTQSTPTPSSTRPGQHH